MYLPRHPSIGHGFAILDGDLDEARANFLVAVDGSVASSAKANQIVRMTIASIFIYVVCVQIATTRNISFFANLTSRIITSFDVLANFLPPMRHGGCFPRLSVLALNYLALFSAVMPFSILSPIAIFTFPNGDLSASASAQWRRAIGLIDRFAWAHFASFVIFSAFELMSLQQISHMWSRTTKNICGFFIRRIVAIWQTRPIIVAYCKLGRKIEFLSSYTPPIRSGFNPVTAQYVANRAIGTRIQQSQFYRCWQIATWQHSLVTVTHF